LRRCTGDDAALIRMQGPARDYDAEAKYNTATTAMMVSAPTINVF
jgi:hypothetical protein